MKQLLSPLLAVLVLSSPPSHAQAPAAAATEEGFVSLFNGKNFEGWRIAGKESAFSIEDGAIKANGTCSHIFHEGKDGGAKFKDFELRMEVMTHENSNGGIFIHTVFQDEGWPKAGYEIQVNNTQRDPQKSGSIFNEVKNPVPFADRTWMNYVIIVKDGVIKVSVNGKELADHRPDPATGRLRPDGGAIAIQAHDDGSTTLYRNIRIKVLE